MLNNERVVTMKYERTFVMVRQYKMRARPKTRDNFINTNEEN